MYRVDIIICLLKARPSSFILERERVWNHGNIGGNGEEKGVAKLQRNQTTVIAYVYGSTDIISLE